MITNEPSTTPPVSTARCPCAACGAPVDPLRAPFVAHIDGGFRYYCSADCHARRLEPVRASVVSRTAEPAAGPGSTTRSSGPRPTVEQTADMLGLSRASLPAALLASAVQPLPSAGGMDPASDPSDGSVVRVPGPRPLPPADARSTWPVVVASLAAGLTALLRGLEVLSAAGTLALVAVCALVAIAAAFAAVAPMRRAPEGILPWAASLVGPVALAVSALRGSAGLEMSSHLGAAAVTSATVAFAVWATQARRAHTRAALIALGRAIPERARVVRGDSFEGVEASRVRAGEEVRVDAGERVPVDGVVRQSDGARVCHIGGEERACPAGVPVLAGARVAEGSLRVLATRAGDDVALARMQRFGDSSAAPTRTLARADRLSLLVPWFAAAIGVLGAVLQTMAGGGDAVTLVWLVICSAPPALGAALGRVVYDDVVWRAAARGIVFRDAAAIEAAASVRSVVLCARGTITRGEPELVDVVSLGELSERELLARAASAEDASREEPIARAVLSAARARDIGVEPARRPTVVPGRGITAVSAGGESIVIGSRRLMLDESIGVAGAEDVARMIEYQGRTAVFVAVDGRVEGVLGFDDPLRDDARPAVQALIDAGFELVLLAGMGRGTLEALGERLDVVNVRPEVLPEERAAAVNAVREVSQRVAVIGRPPRDSAALGVATVAISLAAAGAAVGETSVAMAGDDLRDAAIALSLAREGREKAVRVMAAAVGGSLVAAVLVALVPAVGVIGAAGGAVLVTLGALLASR
ncbi:MAG: HAD-IC family P-type ATPase [Deltaproteobacteria bacterium]